MFWLIVASHVAAQPSQVTSNSALARAQEMVKRTQQQFDTLQKLKQSGSVSQRELRVANYKRRNALLDLSSLLDPSQNGRIMRVRAKLNYQFRLEELKSIDELHRKGAVNELAYRRAVSALEVAKANLKAIESESDTKRKMHLIEAARKKLELMERELSIAKKLYSSGSLNKSTLDQAQSRRNIAHSEYEEYKQGLGASAIQVKQSP